MDDQHQDAQHGDADLERRYKEAVHRLLQSEDRGPQEVLGALLEADALQDMQGGYLSDEIDQQIEEAATAALDIKVSLRTHPHRGVPCFVWEADAGTLRWIIKIWPGPDGWAYTIDEPWSMWEEKVATLLEDADELEEEVFRETLTPGGEPGRASSDAEALGAALIRVAQDELAHAARLEALRKTLENEE